MFYSLITIECKYIYSNKQNIMSEITRILSKIAFLDDFSNKNLGKKRGLNTTF